MSPEFNAELEDCINIVYAEEKEIILLGDLNANFLPNRRSGVKESLRGCLHGEGTALFVWIALPRGLDFTSRLHGKIQPSYWLAYPYHPG